LIGLSGYSPAIAVANANALAANTAAVNSPLGRWYFMVSSVIEFCGFRLFGTNGVFTF
jgi:hypothetical protein